MLRRGRWLFCPNTEHLTPVFNDEFGPLLTFALLETVSIHSLYSLAVILLAAMMLVLILKTLPNNK